MNATAPCPTAATGTDHPLTGRSPALPFRPMNAHLTPSFSPAHAGRRSHRTATRLFGSPRPAPQGPWAWLRAVGQGVRVLVCGGSLAEFTRAEPTELPLSR